MSPPPPAADFELLQCAPLELQLDPENPRLEPEERGGTQPDLRRILIRRFKVEELAASIVASGYTDIDPLIGYRDGDAVVIREGNRRIAALQLLLDPRVAPERERDRWQALSDELGEHGRARISTVGVRVYPSADDATVEAYIGFRHVSGVLEWPAQEKARFIVDMVDRHGWSYQDIARRTGSYPRHVERHYVAVRLIDQAKELQIEGAEHIRIGVLLRALQAGGISEFLGIEYPGDPDASRQPVPPEKEEDVAFFIPATFGPDEREPVLPESRALTKWGRILQSAEAVAYLKGARRPSFERAWVKSGGQQESLAQILNAAADNLEDALPLVPDFREEDEIKQAVERCARRVAHLLRDFPEIRERVLGADAA